MSPAPSTVRMMGSTHIAGVLLAKDNSDRAWKASSVQQHIAMQRLSTAYEEMISSKFEGPKPQYSPNTRLYQFRSFKRSHDSETYANGCATLNLDGSFSTESRHLSPAGVATLS